MLRAKLRGSTIRVDPIISDTVYRVTSRSTRAGSSAVPFQQSVKKEVEAGSPRLDPLTERCGLPDHIQPICLAGT